MKNEEILIVIIAFVIGYVLNMILRPNHIIKRDKISHDIHVKSNPPELGTNCKGYCLNNNINPQTLMIHKSVGVEDCKKKCQENNECKGFNYNTESNNCYLKKQECTGIDLEHSNFINSNVNCSTPTPGTPTPGTPISNNKTTCGEYMKNYYPDWITLTDPKDEGNLCYINGDNKLCLIHKDIDTHNIRGPCKFKYNNNRDITTCEKYVYNDDNPAGSYTPPPNSKQNTKCCEAIYYNDDQDLYCNFGIGKDEEKMKECVHICEKKE